MKTRNFFLMLLSLVVFAGCVKFDQLGNTYYAKKQALEKMLQSEYENYLELEPGYPGGLALKVISDGKEYFLTAGMDGKDVTGQTRFRAPPAGETKDQRLHYRHHSRNRSNVPARHPRVCHTP
jgi:hypothetical protein